MEYAVTHNPQKSRFECTEEGHLCVLDYTVRDNTMTITHTGVPAAIGGRGIAAELTRHALDTARANQWTVRPVCSYAAAYIRRHPQYQNLTA